MKVFVERNFFENILHFFAKLVIEDGTIVKNYVFTKSKFL